ncbi:hypothetical protein FRC00_014615, partial [Tulasnella sp. 408]
GQSISPGQETPYTSAVKINSEDWSEDDSSVEYAGEGAGSGDALMAEDFETSSAELTPKPSPPKHYEASRSTAQARRRVFQVEGVRSARKFRKLNSFSLGQASTYVGHENTPPQLLRDVDGITDVTVSTGPIFAADVELPDDFPQRADDTTQKGTVKATGQQVAVKLLPSVTLRSQEKSSSNSSKLREWRKHYLSLKHTRTAELLGCTLINDNLTVISAWYPNGNIANFLKVGPNVQRTPLLRQIAEGLSYLHNHVPPLIHSNLKPSNILIDNEGNVKLADIGILQLLEATVQPQVQGKAEDIRWIAPEVLDGRQHSKSSDVYAFGCVALSESDRGLDWFGQH